MAELNVQPKKRSPTWIWVIIILVILGGVFTLYRGYNRSYHPTELKITPADSVKKDTIKTNSIALDTAKTDTPKMDTTTY